MGQILFNDKIKTLVHSVGNITMPSGSIVTVGGQQYTTTANISAAAILTNPNTRYQVYAVLVGGAVQLVVSQNENSSGPSGYTTWKLVGSYYTDGQTVVGFGSFVNIVGTPKTDRIIWLPTGNWTTNVAYSGEWHRNGRNVYLSAKVETSGVPSPSIQLTISMPDNIVIDNTKLVTNNSDNTTIMGYGDALNDGVLNHKLAPLVVPGADILIPLADGAASTYLNATGLTAPIPFNWGAGDALIVHVPELAITTWTDTPIEDL